MTEQPSIKRVTRIHRNKKPNDIRTHPSILLNEDSSVEVSTTTPTHNQSEIDRLKGQEVGNEPTRLTIKDRLKLRGERPTSAGGVWEAGEQTFPKADRPGFGGETAPKLGPSAVSTSAPSFLSSIPPEILAEMARRASLMPKTYDYLAQLFPQQVGLITDPNKFKVAVCSRQAGKSFTASSYLLKTCMEKAESDCAYIALTRQSAKRIIWRALKKKVKEMGEIGDKVAFNESDLTVVFPNGSTINLYGANDQATIENLRGTPWVLIVIDEAASYRSDLTYAMDEVIIPALITKEGTLLLIGTPSSDFNSYFYKAYHTLPEFTKHHWTILNNTAIPHAARYIEDLKKKKGWADDNPVLLREYFGQFVRSTENRVYSSYSPILNCVDSLPDIRDVWYYIIGIDIGFKDSNAIVVLAFNPHSSNKTFVIEQWKRNKLSVTELGQVIASFNRKYKPTAIVMDHGGLGVMISEEINRRFGLNIEAAKKTEKMAHIELMNAAFASQELMLVIDGKTDTPLQHELLNLTWGDEEHTMENPGDDNHMTDCTLYAFRKSYSYLHATLRTGKEELTPDEIADRFEDDEEERLNSQPEYASSGFFG